jgi:hypothetical protein
MKRIVPMLAGALLIGLGATAFGAADDPIQDSKGDLPRAAAGDQSNPAEPAECPIKKTIEGKTFCFQNDPALTKPQGGR